MPTPRKKFEQFERVEVIWLDAFSNYDQRHHADFAAYVPCRRSTLGYLLYHDDQRVTICSTDDRGFSQMNTTCQETTTIPIGMVEKIVRLRTAP